MNPSDKMPLEYSLDDCRCRRPHTAVPKTKMLTVLAATLTCPNQTTRLMRSKPLHGWPKQPCFLPVSGFDVAHSRATMRGRHLVRPGQSVPVCSKLSVAAEHFAQSAHETTVMYATCHQVAEKDKEHQTSSESSPSSFSYCSGFLSIWAKECQTVASSVCSYHY